MHRYIATIDPNKVSQDEYNALASHVLSMDQNSELRKFLERLMTLIRQGTPHYLYTEETQAEYYKRNGYQYSAQEGRWIKPLPKPTWNDFNL